ncbi:MAG: hypothetical protein ACM3ML_07620 [Micromonosporaceae bacterium]
MGDVRTGEANKTYVDAVRETSPMLFIRGDEAEEAWRIIGPVMKAWPAGDVSMQEYAVGQAPPGPAL